MKNAEKTKAAILAAARERFATDGYERATIRAIAADANIDPAMVMRYFGNKEKLFTAAAEFNLKFPDLADVPIDDIGRVLVQHFLDRWEADETFLVLLRTSVTNRTAAERMQAIFAQQLQPLIARLSPNSQRSRAALASSQILGIALCRYVLEFPPAVALTRTEIIEWVAPTLQRYLIGDEPKSEPTIESTAT
ncbi:MAG: TetR/AcrR family transcriptional regulator [Corynebacteriales bacterium]|nr:TetR/AcrR family transcriptional regulator [Mycobacteriales bacterium]